MKKFWSWLAKQAVKLAVYAAENPEQVITVVKAVKK